MTPHKDNDVTCIVEGVLDGLGDKVSKELHVIRDEIEKQFAELREKHCGPHASRLSYIEGRMSRNGGTVPQSGSVTGQIDRSGGFVGNIEGIKTMFTPRIVIGIIMLLSAIGYLANYMITQHFSGRDNWRPAQTETKRAIQGQGQGQ
jgi:hypothetical protein